MLSNFTQDELDDSLDSGTDTDFDEFCDGFSHSCATSRSSLNYEKRFECISYGDYDLLRIYGISVRVPAGNHLIPGGYAIDILADTFYLPSQSLIVASPTIALFPSREKFSIHRSVKLTIPLGIRVKEFSRLRCLVSDTYLGELPEWKALPLSQLKVSGDGSAVCVTLHRLSLVCIVYDRHYAPSHRVKLSSATAARLVVPQVPGVSVDFPPQSATTTASIRILFANDPPTSPDLPGPPPDTLASPIVDLEPHGVRFDEPVIVQLPLINAARLSREHGLNVADSLQIWSSDTPDGEPCRWSLLDCDHQIVNIGEELAVKFPVMSFSKKKATWSINRLFGLGAKATLDSVVYPMMFVAFMAQPMVPPSVRFGINVIGYRTDQPEPTSSVESYTLKIGATKQFDLPAGAIEISIKSGVFEADSQSGETLTAVETHFSGEEIDRQFACVLKKEHEMTGCPDGQIGKVSVKPTSEATPIKEFVLEKRASSTLPEGSSHAATTSDQPPSSPAPPRDKMQEWMDHLSSDLAGACDISEDRGWQDFAEHLGFNKAEIEQISNETSKIPTMQKMYQGRGGTASEFSSALMKLYRKRLKQQAKERAANTPYRQPGSGSSSNGSRVSHNNSSIAASHNSSIPSLEDRMRVLSARRKRSISQASGSSVGAPNHETPVNVLPPRPGPFDPGFTDPGASYPGATAASALPGTYNAPPFAPRGSASLASWRERRSGRHTGHSQPRYNEARMETFLSDVESQRGVASEAGVPLPSYDMTKRKRGNHDLPAPSRYFAPRRGSHEEQWPSGEFENKPSGKQPAVSQAYLSPNNAYNSVGFPAIYPANAQYPSTSYVAPSPVLRRQLPSIDPEERRRRQRNTSEHPSDASIEQSSDDSVSSRDPLLSATPTAPPRLIDHIPENGGFRIPISPTKRLTSEFAPAFTFPQTELPSAFSPPTSFGPFQSAPTAQSTPTTTTTRARGASASPSQRPSAFSYLSAPLSAPWDREANTHQPASSGSYTLFNQPNGSDLFPWLRRSLVRTDSGVDTSEVETSPPPATTSDHTFAVPSVPTFSLSTATLTNAPSSNTLPRSSGAAAPPAYGSHASLTSRTDVGYESGGAMDFERTRSADDVAYSYRDCGTSPFPHRISPVDAFPRSASSRFAAAYANRPSTSKPVSNKEIIDLVYMKNTQPFRRDKLIHLLAPHLGQSWKRVLQNLNLEMRIIREVEAQCCNEELVQYAYEGLYRWTEVHPDNVTHGFVYEALVKSDLRAIAQEVCEPGEV